MPNSLVLINLDRMENLWDNYSLKNWVVTVIMEELNIFHW